MKSFDWVRSLKEQRPLIAPSLLAADFARLADEVRRVEDAGAKVLHVDVMDGHFVPNISIGVPVVASLRKVTKLPLDVHLMISDPARYAQPFIDAGADTLLFHIEAVPQPEALLESIRSKGAAPGLVLNPGTPVEAVLPYLDLCDLVLTMSVQPGFGGQAFKSEVLDKVRALAKAVRGDTILSIDGGIGPDTVAAAAAAGIDLFVAGTAVFGADNYTERMNRLRDLARQQY